MCQATLKRLSNRFESCQAQKVASLLTEALSRVEDKKRKKVTVWEAAEYLDLTPGKVLNMVGRGVLKADKFAGAVHIPREEVERIERETAP